MKCSKCGAELTDDTKFCSYCGAKVEENTEMPPIPQTEEKIAIQTKILDLTIRSIPNPYHHKKAKANQIKSRINFSSIGTN